MLYQIGTGNQLPPDFDLFSFIFVTLGATMNGFIILILDRRVANSLKGMEIVTKVVQIKTVLTRVSEHLENSRRPSNEIEGGAIGQV